MKMLNNYLLCEEVEKEVTSNFYVEDQSRSTKDLMVIESSETDIPKDSIIRVPFNAGQTDESGIYIRRNEVIGVL